MERKIGDIKDKKLKAENITLAAIYNCNSQDLI